MESILGAFYFMEYFCCPISVKASIPLLQMTDIDTSRTSLHNTLYFLCVCNSEKALSCFYLFYRNMCVCNSAWPGQLGKKKCTSACRKIFRSDSYGHRSWLICLKTAYSSTLLAFNLTYCTIVKEWFFFFYFKNNLIFIFALVQKAWLFMS